MPGTNTQTDAAAYIRPNVLKSYCRSFEYRIECTVYTVDVCQYAYIWSVESGYRAILHLAFYGIGPGDGKTMALENCKK